MIALHAESCRFAPICEDCTSTIPSLPDPQRRKPNGSERDSARGVEASQRSLSALITSSVAQPGTIEEIILKVKADRRDLRTIAALRDVQRQYHSLERSLHTALDRLNDSKLDTHPRARE